MAAPAQAGREVAQHLNDQRVDLGDGSYWTSRKQYDSRLRSGMFQRRQTSWAGHFESWNMMYTQLIILVHLMALAWALSMRIHLLGYPAEAVCDLCEGWGDAAGMCILPLLALILILTFCTAVLIVYMVIYVDTSFGHLGWYCIVTCREYFKKPVLLIWALLYLTSASLVVYFDFNKYFVVSLGDFDKSLNPAWSVLLQFVLVLLLLLQVLLLLPRLALLVSNVCVIFACVMLYFEAAQGEPTSTEFQLSPPLCPPASEAEAVA